MILIKIEPVAYSIFPLGMSKSRWCFRLCLCVFVCVCTRDWYEKSSLRENEEVGCWLVVSVCIILYVFDCVSMWVCVQYEFNAIIRGLWGGSVVLGHARTHMLARTHIPPHTHTDIMGSRRKNNPVCACVDAILSGQCCVIQIPNLNPHLNNTTKSL